MKQKSIKKNFIYNFALTFVNMIFPLVTAPYLSAILGASGIGKVNYATSIMNWFIIFATFGIPRYAMREIAKHRNDKEKMSSIFWNLISLQAIFTAILLSIYFIAVFNLDIFSQDISLYVIMSLMLILNIFSIDWFYQGIEEYGYITIRNIIVKIISLILMFLIVKNPDDYILYAGINILGLSFNNILNYLHSLKYVNRKIGIFQPLYFIKQLKIFFLISLVVALYSQLDQLFLGTVNEIDLAYYMRSKMILNVGLSLTTALVNVISPRAAYLIHNDHSQYKAMIQKVITYVYLMGVPIMVGMFLLATDVMYVLGGSEFLPASISLQIITPLVLFATLGSWISGQILIPNKLEEKSFRIQLVSVFISIGLNIVLIPLYSYIGAAITWLLVETFLFIAKAIYARIKLPELQINYFSWSALKIVISSLAMASIVLFVKGIFTMSLVTLAITVACGAITYFICLIILKEETVYGLLKILKK